MATMQSHTLLGQPITPGRCGEPRWDRSAEVKGPRFSTLVAKEIPSCTGSSDSSQCDESSMCTETLVGNCCRPETAVSVIDWENAGSRTRLRSSRWRCSTSAMVTSDRAATSIPAIL